jgi:DNA-binding NtrC family response regulator
MAGRADVLVLDDEAIVCERLQKHLEKHGFAVEAFTSSERAVERLAEKSFDVVVTDLKMPGPTGLDVLHHLRDHAPGTQVVIITGFATIEAAREAEWGGVFEFVTKPFDLETIAEVVGKAARRAGRRRGQAVS